MPKRSNKQRSRKNRGQPFTHAPLQGMGETHTWRTNDVQAVTFPAAVGDNVYGLRLSADVNGFAWIVTQAGAAVVSSSTTGTLLQALYGENNSQFARLASLWQEFRVDHISMEWQPVGMGGQVNMTTAVTINDETGRLQGTAPLDDTAEQLSSQKNVHLHSPYMRTKRTLNLKKWLGQTQPRPWLQTQEPGTTQIIRETYDTPITAPNGTLNSVARTPALAMVAGFNFSGSGFFSSNVTLGAVIFSCQFTFRQRRNLISDPFLDQTLLYVDEKGCRHKRKLEQEEISRVLNFLDEEQGVVQTQRKDTLEVDLSASLIERIKKELT